MRIAQIAPLCESVPPKLYGGTERVIDNLTRGLLRAGVDVTVFCSGDSTIEAEIEAVHPEALRLGSRAIRDPFAYQIKMLGAIARQAGDFDLIHNHYDYPLLPLSLMCETPILSTQHGRLDLPDLVAAYANFADAPVVSISDSQREPLPHLNWQATIWHGIDLSGFEARETPGKYLAFLGRFSPDKRPEWAIEIARRAGIPLKIAAKIEPLDQHYYDTRVKPLIDGRFIEYVGEISEPEKSDFLGNALALVFPIDWPEPFGLVMVEAMACGTPVLARPEGAARELLVEGKTGYSRRNIRDLAELAHGVAKLDRRFIRRYAELNFSIARMTEEYLHVYRRLIQGRNQARPLRIAENARRMADHRRDLLHPVDGTSDGNRKNSA